MNYTNYCLVVLVLQSIDQDVRKELTPLKLRAKAAKFAKDTVKNQMASFKVNFVHSNLNIPCITVFNMSLSHLLH